VTAVSRLRNSWPRLRVLRALVAREYRIRRSYRFSLLGELVFGLGNLAFYYFISRTLGPPRTSLNGAPSYFDFAAVGLALGVVIQAASMGLGRRVREDQLTGTLETLVAQPVRPSELALGTAGFPFLLAMFHAILYLVMAGLVLGLSFGEADWPGVVLSLGASAIAFTSLGMVLAALVLLFKRSEAVAAVVALVLSFLGGALFPVKVLPGWLEALSTLVPTRYAFDSVRSAIFGAGSWAKPTLVLVIFTTVAMPLAILAFARALAFNQRRASLGQY
jgi:ABC-2 type transport system permease protein